MVAPVGEASLLDFLVQRLLHAVKVLEVVDLGWFEVSFAAGDGFLEHAATAASIVTIF